MENKKNKTKLIALRIEEGLYNRLLDKAIKKTKENKKMSNVSEVIREILEKEV